ncbi:MAG: helix-turn-helix domain-containing protein [Planctomycetota bacterium]
MIDTREPPLVRLTGFGDERYAGRYGFDTRRRRENHKLVIQVTLVGTQYYEQGGERRVLPAGHGWCDFIPGDFRYGNAGRDLRIVWFSCSGAYVEAFARHIHGTAGPTFFLGDPAPFAAAIGRLDRLPDQTEFARSAECYGILMLVLSLLRQQRVGEDPRIANALRLIERNASDPAFGVLELADMLDVSREHLARQFRAALGRSPGEQIARQRVRLAADLLRTDKSKLDEIARRSGFGSATYLCRVFRKHVGLTPAVFRRQPGMTVP